MNELQQQTVRAIVNVFETGHVLGDYSAITVLKGDAGHLTYGRSQASLASGALFQLLDNYCSQDGARFAAPLRPALPRFEQKDTTLDADQAVQKTLVEAGTTDPVMREVQDQFFDRRYLTPACSTAQALGLTDPLCQAVVYDSWIQGGWSIVKQRISDVSPKAPRDWVKKYVAARTIWLQQGRPPLPTTVYRMKTFDDLMQADNWVLTLPIVVLGVTITVESLEGDVPMSGAQKRILKVMTPYLRGTDVRALQQALQGKGLPATLDGVYGPFTDALVSEWQRSKSIREEGVGPATRQSLGI